MHAKVLVKFAKFCDYFLRKLDSTEEEQMVNKYSELLFQILFIYRIYKNNLSSFCSIANYI